MKLASYRKCLTFYIHFQDHILIDKEDANDRNKNGQAKTNFRYFSKMAYIKSEIDKATQISDIRLFLLRCFELLDVGFCFICCCAITVMLSFSDALLYIEIQ